MKTKLKLALTAGIFLAVTLLASCNFFGLGTTLTFTSMPYDSIGKIAYLQTLDKNGNYHNKKLGTIKSDTCTYNVLIPNNTVTFFGMIVEYEVDYYIAVSTENGILDEYTLNGYWIDASQTKYDTGNWYATSADYIESLDLNTTLTLDFEKKPFYIYQIDNVKGKNITATFNGTEHSNIYITTELTKVLKQQLGNEKNYFASNYCFIPEDDTLYIFIRPINYGEWENSKAVLTVCDCTDLVKNSVEFKQVLPYSDTELLLSAETGLYTYDVKNEKLTTVKEFDNAVVSPIPYKNGFYFGSGNNVYFYDRSTVKKCFSVNNKVAGLCASEDILYVIHKRGSWATAEVFNTATEEKITSNTMVENPVENGIVYIPENNTVYYIDKDVSPTDIVYLYWNEEKTYLNDGDSPYHGDFSFAPPLLRYGNEMAIIDGNGRIFSVEEEDHLKVIKNTGINSTSIVFDDTYLYALCTNTEKNSCSIKKYLISAPEKDPVKEVTFENELGVTLIKKDNSIQVITKDAFLFYKTDDDYNPTTYYKLLSKEINFDLEALADEARSITIPNTTMPSYYNQVKVSPSFDLE